MSHYNLSSKILLLIVLLWYSAAAQAETLTGEQILAKVQQAQNDIEDLQSNANLLLDVTLGFLPYSENLDGKYYYKKPNQHRLVFDDAPSYFDNLPNMFSWKVPDLNKYSVKTKKVHLTDGTSVHKLYFSPTNPDSKTRSIAYTVEPTQWSLIEQETLYKDGGELNLKFEYTALSGRQLLKQINAKVRLASYPVKGKATIRFSSHQLNKGLSDSVFE